MTRTQKEVTTILSSTQLRQHPEDAQVWTLKLQRDAEKLERVQQRVTKIIGGLKRMTCKQLWHLSSCSLVKRPTGREQLLQVESLNLILSNNITRGNSHRLQIGRLRLDVRDVFMKVLSNRTDLSERLCHLCS